jgi:hypothetical protein
MVDPKPLDTAALDAITGGAPKPLRGKMGDLDFCNALDTRWMAYRELGMTKQQRPVEARADRCWSAFIKKLDAAVPRR